MSLWGPILFKPPHLEPAGCQGDFRSSVIHCWRIMAWSRCIFPFWEWATRPLDCKLWPSNFRERACEIRKTNTHFHDTFCRSLQALGSCGCVSRRENRMYPKKISQEGTWWERLPGKSLPVCLKNIKAEEGKCYIVSHLLFPTML